MTTLPPSARPSLEHFFHHPGHSVAAAFTLGLVTMTSFQFLLGAIDASRWVQLKALPWLLKVLKDEGDNRDVDTEKGYDQERIESLEVNQEDSGWMKDWVHQTASPPLSDPGNLRALLNGAIFIHALGAFGTLVGYLPVTAGETGCAFVTAWNVLSGQFIPILGFLHIAMLDLRQSRKVGTYELAVLCSLLAVRLVLNLASAAMNAGVAVPLPSPFVDSALCLPKTNTIIGALATSFDITFSLTLLLRLFVYDIKKRRLRWRIVLKVLLNRPYAKVGALLLLSVSGAAGNVGSGNLATRWVPPTLSLLLILHAFNRSRPLSVTTTPFSERRTSIQPSPLSNSPNSIPPDDIDGESIRKAQIGFARRTLFSVSRHKQCASSTDGDHFLQAIQSPLTLSSRPPELLQRSVQKPPSSNLAQSFSNPQPLEGGPAFLSRRPNLVANVREAFGKFRRGGESREADSETMVQEAGGDLPALPAKVLLPASRSSDGFFRTPPSALKTDLGKEQRLGTAFDDGESEKV